MPPHCDSLDGPVVTAARRALEASDVSLVLRFVPESAEAELRDAFDLALEARAEGGAPQEVADRWLFETAVRLHREGEGAPFTGLKPAGPDVGPVIPVAEREIETGTPEGVTAILESGLEAEVRHRFAEVTQHKADAGRSVEDARAYVHAMLRFEVWAHHLHQAIHAGAHEA